MTKDQVAGLLHPEDILLPDLVLLHLSPTITALSDFNTLNYLLSALSLIDVLARNFSLAS